MIYLSAFADEISKDPLEQLDILEQHGIRHIEFRSIYGINVLDLPDEKHEEFRALLRKRGFGLSAIGSPVGKIKITESFDDHLTRIERSMMLAEFYGTPRIRVFSYYMPPGEDTAQYRDEVMKRIGRFGQLAAERKLSLVLENEKGIYGDTAPRVLDILKTVDSPSLSHAFDPANYVEVGQPIDEAWELLRDRVTHFHVKDYDARTHKNVPAGEGNAEIPKLLADAVARGYSGFCVLEPHLVIAELAYGFTGPERFADAVAALKGILNRAGIAYA